MRALSFTPTYCHKTLQPPDGRLKALHVVAVVTDNGSNYGFVVHP